MEPRKNASRSRAELEKARIDRTQAQQNLEALQKLQSSGAASTSEISAAQARLAVDSSTIQSLEKRQSDRYSADDMAHAKAALDDAQAAYGAAENTLQHAVVHAPFAGTVYSVPVSRTEYVNQGDRLLSMADLSKLQVRAYFDEPEVGKLQVGQPVAILWDAQAGSALDRPHQPPALDHHHLWHAQRGRSAGGDRRRR